MVFQAQVDLISNKIKVSVNQIEFSLTHDFSDGKTTTITINPTPLINHSIKLSIYKKHRSLDIVIKGYVVSSRP